MCLAIFHFSIFHTLAVVLIVGAIHLPSLLAYMNALVYASAN